MARTTGDREGISMTPEPTSKPGKRKSHPTSKARNQRQKAKKKAAREREAAIARERRHGSGGMVFFLCWKPIDVSGMTAQAARRSGHASVRDDQSGRQDRKTFQPILRIEGMKPTVTEGAERRN
jgi:hypothetical protein